MITTNLTGNLGNHMWQYAVCRTIAEQLGYEWGINSSPSYDYHHGRNQMEFMNVDFGKPISNITNKFCEKWLNYKHVDSVNITMLDKNLFNIKDNSIILGDNESAGAILQSEDYILHRRNDVLKWFAIKDEYKNSYDNKLKELNIQLDDNLCVINFRGGEYRGIPNVLLRKEYWRDCISHMLLINSNMRFLVITDDPECARNFMPFSIPTIHVDIGFDFYVVNSAKYLIISNSSFGWWCAWLNTKCNCMIAPKYWARHNVSDGYWATGDSYTSLFEYMDRNGYVSDYETCKKEALEYYVSKGIL